MEIGKPNQIRIVQSGGDVFAFDTIHWPEDTFPFPIVYTAWAMAEGSYDANRIGWKWIKREQFEWLVRHCHCMVSHTGVREMMSFYCHNHECWEREGKDWSPLLIEPDFYIDPDMDEERKV